MPMSSVTKNLRIGFVSASIGLIGCPICLIMSQLFSSVVTALSELFSGVVGAIISIAITAIIIAVGANKFADVGMKITVWVLNETNAHRSIAAAISILLGAMFGTLLGAFCYRLIWMSTQSLAAK